MNQSRQHHLDALRGIAALIVLVAHYFAAFYPYTIFGDQGNYQQHSLWENIFFYPPFGLLVAGHFAVCLFFILSGYVLSYNYLGETLGARKILASIIKRPIRLGGLVLFTIILGFCLSYGELYFNSAVADISNSKPWFSKYWSGFELHQLVWDVLNSMFARASIYNPPLWTIEMELYGSIRVLFFTLIFGKFKYRLFVLIAILFFFKNSLYSGFFLGILIADLVRNHNLTLRLQSRSFSNFALLIMFIYFSSFPNYLKSDPINSTIYRYLPHMDNIYPMLAAVLLFIAVTINEPIKNILRYPSLQFTGRVSYGVYVLHFLVMGSISSWLFLNLINYMGYDLAFLFTLITGILVTLLLAYWVTIYIDDPVIKLASYVGEGAIAFIRLETLIHLKRFLTRGL